MWVMPQRKVGVLHSPPSGRGRGRGGPAPEDARGRPSLESTRIWDYGAFQFCVVDTDPPEAHLLFKTDLEIGRFRGEKMRDWQKINSTQRSDFMLICTRQRPC